MSTMVSLPAHARQFIWRAMLTKSSVQLIMNVCCKVHWTKLELTMQCKVLSDLVHLACNAYKEFCKAYNECLLRSTLDEVGAHNAMQGTIRDLVHLVCNAYKVFCTGYNVCLLSVTLVHSYKILYQYSVQSTRDKVTHSTVYSGALWSIANYEWPHVEPYLCRHQPTSPSHSP